MADVIIRIVVQDQGKVKIDSFGKSIDLMSGRVSKASTTLGRFKAGVAKVAGGIISAQVVTAIYRKTVQLLSGAFFGAIAAARDFETAFTGVKKTVDETVNTSFAQLREDLSALATQDIPLATTEIFGIAEAAGQLGVGADDIVKFTKVMGQLGVTTNLSASEAATAIARFSNITGSSLGDVDRLASSIVALGNSTATTEREITEMGLRIAAAGSLIGLTDAQILGFAASLSSVGVQAQAGGSAISRTFIDMSQAVSEGGEKLQDFATVAGETAGDFAELFGRDANEAVLRFIEGLGKLDQSSVFAALDRLELSDIRVRDSLLRAAGAGEKFRETIELSTLAFEENNAAATEAALRNQTFESQVQFLKNAFFNLGAALGDAITKSDAMKEIVLFLVGAFINLRASIKDNEVATISFVSSGINLLLEGFRRTLEVIGGVLFAVGSLAEGFTNAELVFLRFVRSVIEGQNVLTKFIPGLKQVGETQLAVVDTMISFVESQKSLASATTEAGKSALAMAGKVSTLQMKVEAASKAQIAAVGAGRQLSDELKAVTEDMDRLASVISENGVGKLTEQELLFASNSIKEFKKAGLELPPVLQEVADRIQAMGGEAALAAGGIGTMTTMTDEAKKAAEEYAESIIKLRERIQNFKDTAFSAFGLTLISMQQSANETKAAADEMENLNRLVAGIAQTASGAAAPLGILSEKVGGLKVETRDWGEVLKSIPSVMGAVGNVLAIFGVEIDSVIGKITRFISLADSLINSLGGIIGAITGGGGGGGGGGLAGLFGSLFGGGGGADFVGPLQDAGSKAGTGLLSGFGATVSKGLGSLGSTLAPFFTNPFTIAIGAGIISFFALKGLFGGGRNAETVAEEAGRDLGVAFSEGLAKQINEGGKNVQLSLADIFAETGAAGFGAEGSSFGLEGIDRFAEEVGDIFSGVEQGLFSTQEAAMALAESVPILIQNFSSLGSEGRQQVLRIVAAAERLGVEFEGLDELSALIGNGVRLGADEAIAAFEDMGGSIKTWGKFLQKETTDATRALDRLAKVLGRVQAGLDLNETQIRFLGRTGLPEGAVPGMQAGGFVPATPGGRVIRVAEGGQGEFIVPENRMRGGGGNVSISFAPNIFVDGIVSEPELAKRVGAAVISNVGDLEGQIVRAMQRRGDLARR